MLKIRFPLGLLAPDPAGGAYKAPPDPLAVFKGATSKRREGRGRGREKEKEVEGMKWDGPGPPNMLTQNRLSLSTTRRRPAGVCYLALPR